MIDPEGITCKAIGPAGLQCTRGPGHDGDHIADDPAINVTFDRWANSRKRPAK